MIRRPLAILSEGRLTLSQSRAITLLSLGLIEVFLAPLEEDEKKKKGGGASAFVYNNKKDYREDDLKEKLKKRLLQDDDEIYAIINIFMECH